MLHAVIMAGGAGTRFWPMSRVARPKQLLALAAERTLLEETAARLEGAVPPQRIHVVTSARHAARVRDLLPRVPANQVIGEPCGRDTAACLGLAAHLIAQCDPEATVIALPADHVIRPAAAFRELVTGAAGALDERPGSLVVLGVKPDRAATGYGYIQRGAEIRGAGGPVLHRVAAFREKPDAATAARFVASGEFLWNAGILLFRAATLLERLGRHLPELAAGLARAASRLQAEGAIAAADYAALPRISIDYGVLERDADVLVAETTFAWDDVGSFAALDRVLEPDAAGNRAAGALTALDAAGNIVVAAAGHHVGLIGVSGLVVIHTEDATLVCRKEDAERVKELVARLEARGLAGLL